MELEKTDVSSIDTTVSSTQEFTTESRFWISTSFWLLLVLSMLLAHLDYYNWIPISDHLGNRLTGSAFPVMVFAWIFLAVGIIIVTVDEARVQLRKIKEPFFIY